MSWIKQDEQSGTNYTIFQSRLDRYHNTHLDIEMDAVVLEAAETTNVVAITPDDQILLVKQYRFGSEKDHLEIPGGIVDAGEDILAASRRELREETGYSGDEWHALGSIYANPVFMTNQCHHYLLKNAIYTDDVQWDATEEIELVLMPLTILKKNIFDLIDHPHSLSALMRVLQIDLDPKIRL